VAGLGKRRFHHGTRSGRFRRDVRPAGRRVRPAAERGRGADRNLTVLAERAARRGACSDGVGGRQDSGRLLRRLRWTLGSGCYPSETGLLPFDGDAGGFWRNGFGLPKGAKRRFTVEGVQSRGQCFEAARGGGAEGGMPDSVPGRASISMRGAWGVGRGKVKWMGNGGRAKGRWGS